MEDMGHLEEARLGLCELQDPVWAKMSALATGVTKKRKKSETKPQSQINKCNNEKRRREQENIYIEELAELISANIADMSSLSVKPDKCAILQEAVNQIRSIKRAEAAQAAQGGGATNAIAVVSAQPGGGVVQPATQQPAAAVDPVQQGEVSSSRPTILSNEVYGPLLLEALEGFLFVVNSEGKVEHVTENVSTYIKFTREDVLGKSIYNFIHHGDHAKFHTNLLPMAIEWGGPGGAGSGEQQSPAATRSKSIDIRLLVKPAEDTDETLEEKQQRVSFYELMHISSTQLKDNLSVSEEDGSDSGPCLLCVASRISHRDKVSCSIEQFTTKLDTGGKVICVDTSGVSESLAQTIKKELKNRQLRELVLQQDLQKLNAHLRETVSTGQSTSALYRLQIGTDKYVQVQTKSKFFKTIPHATNDSDFIMATHSIIGDNDSGGGPTDPGGGGGTCTTPTPTAGGGVGGPLMTSVVNGTAGVAAPPPRTASNGPPPDSSALLQFTLDSEFNLDFNFPTSSSWDLDGGWQTETAPASVSRPNSRTNTPTTPTRQQGGGDPYASGQSQVQSSPYGGHQPQQSPVTANPSTPASASSNHYPGSGGFPFSPMTEQSYQPVEEQKDSKAGVLEEAAVMAAASSESTRLRNLLLKPSEDKNRDRILKELLKEEDDGMKNTGPRSLLGRAMMGGACDTPKAVVSGTGNNMLRQLLNEKSDEDDAESRAGGVKKKSELLQQLLKPERDAGLPGEEEKRDGGNGGGSGGGQCQNDTLLTSLGFPPSPGRKRHGEDKDDAGPAGKRHSDGAQVSSSGTGNSLQERNKLLATLLAKQPTNHQPIPPIPASIISATPQEKLPRITDPNKSIQMAMSQSQGVTLNNRMGGINRLGPGRPPQHSQQQQQQNYLNSVLAAAANRQLSQQQQCYSSPATSTTDGSATGWDSSGLGSPSLSASSAVAPSVLTANQAADPLLSEILEQVIDIVPDDLMHLLDGTAGISSDGQQLSLSETAAINMIQRSLMQCESVMVKTGQGGMATPPAYSTALGQQQGVFPPPPNYSQAKFQRMQMRTAAATGQPYPANITNQLLLQQQQRKQLLQQQQEHKRRLLLQQKQQQLLIPSNAAAAGEMGAMQNIDSLMNSTVAPNVSLQRSSSVPDQQLSPGYGTQRQQQQQQQQQQPYSPHSQLASPLGGSQFSGGGQSGVAVSQASAGGGATTPSYQAAAAAAAARLSPQAQFTAQLSPRGAYPQAATAVSWQQQQQRQQNPMLSAQLTRPPQQSQQQQVQQRALNSPYQADQFPPPASPTSAFGGQYLRLQRTNSAPTATTQLPGALGSPSGRGGSYSSSPSPVPSSSSCSSRDHQQQQHHHPHHQPHPPHYPAPPPLASHPHPHNMYPHHPGEPPHSQPPHQYCHQYEQAAAMAAYNGGHQTAAPRPLHQGIPTSVANAVQSQQAAAAVAAAAAAAAAAAGGPTSEFVRQELRAVVGARTQQQQQQQPTARQQQPQQQQPTVGDLESLGITFEMGGSDSPKLWGTMGSDMSSMSPPQHQAATSRTTMEEARQGDQKSSLLQKLLSE